MNKTIYNLKNILFSNLNIFNNYTSKSNHIPILNPTYSIIFLKSILHNYHKIKNNPHKPLKIITKIKQHTKIYDY